MAGFFTVKSAKGRLVDGEHRRGETEECKRARCGMFTEIKGYKFHYLKTQRGAKTPDYLVEHEKEKFVIEIGGKGKGRERFKGIKIEKN